MNIRSRNLTVVFRQLRYLLLRRHTMQIIVLVFLAIMLSIIETVGVSVIMPFISVATNNSLLDSGVYKTLFDFLHFTSKTNFIAFGFAIIVFYAFRAIYNVWHITHYWRFYYRYLDAVGA